MTHKVEILESPDELIYNRKGMLVRLTMMESPEWSFTADATPELLKVLAEYGIRHRIVEL